MRTPVINEPKENKYGKLNTKSLPIESFHEHTKLLLAKREKIKDEYNVTLPKKHADELDNTKI